MRQSGWLRRWRLFCASYRTQVALVFCLALGAIAGAAPFLACPGGGILVDFGPNETLTQEVGSPPSSPTRRHPLGTDDRGRDVVARFVYGLRYSLGFAVFAWSLAMGLACVTGMGVALLGLKSDLLSQRVLEIFDSLPPIYLVLFSLSLFRPSLGLLALLWALFTWVPLSRYWRAETLRLRREPFILACEALGFSRARLWGKHYLPHTLLPLLTFSPFYIATALGGIAALDFLGLGLPPPLASWGELLRQGRENPGAWWLTWPPVIGLTAVVLALQSLSDGIRRAFSG